VFRGLFCCLIEGFLAALFLREQEPVEKVAEGGEKAAEESPHSAGGAASNRLPAALPIPPGAAGSYDGPALREFPRLINAEMGLRGVRAKNHANDEANAEMVKNMVMFQ
jgi:hypothetical protein